VQNIMAQISCQRPLAARQEESRQKDDSTVTRSGEPVEVPGMINYKKSPPQIKVTLGLVSAFLAHSRWSRPMADRKSSIHSRNTLCPSYYHQWMRKRPRFRPTVMALSMGIGKSCGQEWVCQATTRHYRSIEHGSVIDVEHISTVTAHPRRICNTWHPAIFRVVCGGSLRYATRTRA
jgi:hypothetical protein